MRRDIDPGLLYRSLFANIDDPEWWTWVRNNVPDNCLPNRRGYPWANLLRTFGERTMREVFKHGNFEQSEASYWAEQKLIAWCKRNHRSWSPVSTAD